MDNDMISREALLTAIDNERKMLIERGLPGGEHVVVHSARRLIEEAPSVDAVPVVRCRDCRYFDTIMGEYGRCDRLERGLDANFYCRDGQRYSREGAR